MAHTVAGATPTPGPNLDWFVRDRFGMFIHFGLYSTLARHEWVMTYERIPTDDYVGRAQFFDPDLFDPHDIARSAKAAGMKYVVLTAKHHEGFAMWDTKLSDYKITTHTGRDIIKEFTEAMRQHGLKVGLYYSVIDWHHPHYPIDYHHPRRDDPDAHGQNETRDIAIYREYLHGQVTELLTNYGEINYLFYDFTYPEDRDGWRGKYPQDWHATELMELTRRLQPGIIVNDRLGIPGDLVTPEQYQPDEPMRRDGREVVWEACQTLNGSWGYDRENQDFKTTDMLVRMLVDSVSKNGNVLLNIGPNGRGAITDRDRAILTGLGQWMDLHSKSIYAAGASAIAAPRGTVITQRDNHVYVHLLVWPFGHIHLAGLAGKVRLARFVNDSSELKCVQIDPQQAAWNTTPGGQPPGTLTVHLPVVRPNVAVPVIELILN